MSDGLKAAEGLGETSRIHRRADPRDFAHRHRFLLVLLWLQLPVMAAVGLSRGEPLPEVAAACLLLIILATVGMVAKSRTVATGAVVLGLIESAGILVLYMNGSTESLFVFFVAITAISLYKDWRPLLFGFAAVAAFHIIAGSAVSVPADTEMQAAADPAVVASIHLGATLVLVLVLVAGWRLAARSDGRHARSVEGFRLGFETAPVGMAILTPSGEFLQANLALNQVLGYQEGNLTGVHVDSVIHGDDHGDLGKAWEHMSNVQTHTAEAYLRCVTTQGRAVWTRLSLSLIPWTPEQPAVVLLHLEDLTRSHRDQKQLEHVIDRGDRFVAAVGEELRQPLSEILELASPSDKDHVELDATVGTIESHALEAAAMVDDLVFMAGAHTAPIPVVECPIDASRLCREVVEKLTRSKIPMSFGAKELWADPDLTKHIVSTLIRNAIRYGGPRVELVTLASGPDTVIQVIDNGSEIPASEQVRIFSSDLRGGQSATEPVSVGLGLSVARYLARKMDGDLAYRRSPDGLNLFELRLPSEQLRPVTTAPGRLEPASVGAS